MLSKIAQPRLSRAFLLVLVAVIALAAVACSAAPSRGWSGPLVSDNILFVGTLQGKILVLDLSTADPASGLAPELEWPPKDVVESVGSNFTCGRVSNPMGLYGTPAVENGRLYIGAYDGNVLWVALDGSAVSDPKFDSGGHIAGSVAIAGETLYVGNSKGTLYAMDLNLNEKWRFKTGGEIFSTPVVQDHVVYVTSADHNLYAVDAESGKEIWRFETKAAIMSTPLVADGRVYVGGCDRKFYSIQAATEEERVAAASGAPATVRESQAVFDGAGNWFWTQALIYNGEIWVGCLDHKVYVLDAESLEYVTEIKTGGMVYAPPVLFPSQELIVVGSQDGRLYAIHSQTKEVDVYAIDSKTGQVFRSPDEPKTGLPPILAPMTVDDQNGVLYFHAQDGTHTLYAFSLTTAEVLWSFRTDKISD